MTQLEQTESPAARHRRVRMPLSDGHMDVCLAPDASAETIAALRNVGEAALSHLRKEQGMTWTISMTGHDDLTGEEKEALEKVIVGEATGLFHSLKAQEGNRVSAATVTTNTTGSVNLLAEATEG